jgi:hypothetical protein
MNKQGDYRLTDLDLLIINDELMEFSENEFTYWLHKNIGACFEKRGNV